MNARLRVAAVVLSSMFVSATASAGAVIVGANGLCLEVSSFPAGDGDHGQAVFAGPCSGGASQRWTSYAGQIRAFNGMCLDVTRFAAGDDGQGRVVMAWPCHGGLNQRWSVTPLGIRSATGPCLDLTRYPSGSGDQGFEVLAWPCHGQENQRWAIANPDGPGRAPPLDRSPSSPVATPGQGADEIVSVAQVENLPASVTFRIRYRYSGRYSDPAVPRRAVLGVVPTGDGVIGSGIGFTPALLAPGAHYAVVRVSKTTPGVVATEGFRFYMYTCEGENSCSNSMTFHARELAGHKTWNPY